MLRHFAMQTVRPVFLVFFLILFVHQMEARPRLKLGEKFNAFRKFEIPLAEADSYDEPEK